MLKTDYIKDVKIIKKGKMDDIVLPNVSDVSISKKEVFRCTSPCFVESGGGGDAYSEDTPELTLWQLRFCKLVKTVIALYFT